MRLPWDELEVTVGDCGRVRCEPGWRLAPEWSRRLRDLDLWFVWAGRGSMQLGEKQQIELRPGVCLWMRPGGRYVAQQDLHDRLGVTFVHFDLTTSRGKRPAVLPAEVHELVDVAYVDGLLRRVVELMQQDAQAEQAEAHRHHVAVAAQLLRGVLMDIEAGAGQAPASSEAGTGTARHHREMVFRLASRIRESPGQVPSVTQLAREAGYSPEHFGRVFRSVLGLGPQSFIVQQRLGRARQLLGESSLSVKQIAHLLGYESVYFFSRQFKQKIGHSPSHYRKSLAPQPPTEAARGG